MFSSARLSQICLATIALNALLRLAVAAALPITYKEAYFWEWSRHLAIGYLDHPPMVAWIIATFSFLAPGPSVLAVRAGALVMGLASLGLLYRLAVKMFKSSDLALKAVLIALCLPVLNAVWTLMLPDSPLLFFQLLAMNIFVSIKENNRTWSWPLLGIVVGLGLMCKVTFVLSIAASLLFLLTKDSPPWRGKDLALATAFALLLFSPYLWWNGTQHWVGFRLQLWARHMWDFGFAWGKVGEVLGEQIAAGTPILLPLFIACLFLKAPSAWPGAFRFLRFQVAAVLGFFFVAGAFVSQTHPHWTALAYPPAALMLAAVWQTQPKRHLVKRLGAALVGIQAVLLGAMLLLIAAPQVAVHVDPDWLGGSLGRGFVKGRQRLLGFGDLRAQLEEVIHEQGLDPDVRILTNSYQLAGPLSFALDGAPVVCLDAYTSKYPVMGHAQPFYYRIGGTNSKAALFVARDCNPRIQEQLRRHFSRVIELPPLEQRYAGEIIGIYGLYLVDPGATSDLKLP